MSDGDIFREVDEELRREQLKSLWDKFGGFVIGGAVLIVLVVGGREFYHYRQVTKAAEDGASFSKAMNLRAEALAKSADTKPTKALIDNLKSLKQNGNTGYAALGKLSLAAARAAQGDTDDAVGKFDLLAKDSGGDPTFRDFARLQAAQLRLEKASPSEMKTRLAPLLDDKSSWRFSATELLGLSYYQAGQFGSAEKVLSKALVGLDVPPNLKQRIDMLLQVVSAAKNAQTATDKTAQPANKMKKPDDKSKAEDKSK